MKPIYTILALFFFVGCSHNPEEVDLIDPADGLTVEAEQGVYTRNGFDASGVFYWSQGDRLGVTTDVAPTQFSALTLTEGAGTASAKFQGTVTGRMGNYAVYPMADNHLLSGQTLTYHLPQSYTYTKVDADYFVDPQGTGNSFNAPMWGAISAGKVQMKHLGGVFCVKVQKLPVGDNLTFRFVSGQKIHGDFTADLSQPTPTLATQARANEEEATVQITFSNSVEGASGVFYVPAPVGTYENARVKILNEAEELYNTALGTITMARCDLKPIELVVGEIIINDKNFPDANFRSYVMSNFDKDKSGSFSQEELDAVTAIYVNNQNISSLKGVEFFEQVRWIHCYRNQLTDLDVSKNTELRELHCYENQLTNLDVSGCTKLNMFYGYNNQLTSLDVSGCTALTELHCAINQLTSLDVSQNTALKNLDCFQNQLTNLDLRSQNTTLIRLNCWGNPLTSLGVSQNAKLKELYCQSTQLKILDISSSRNLVKLNISDNKYLETVYVSNLFFVTLKSSPNLIKDETFNNFVEK